MRRKTEADEGGDTFNIKRDVETRKNLHGMLLSSCCNTQMGTLINGKRKKKIKKKNEKEFPPECLVV